MLFLLIYRKNLADKGPVKGVSAEFLKRTQHEVVSMVRPKVFMDMEDHFTDIELASSDDHGTQIIKAMVDVFTRTMMYHHGRLYTQRYILDNQTSKRHKLTKTILFLNQ